MPTSLTVSTGDSTTIGGVVIRVLWIRGDRVRLQVTPQSGDAYEVDATVGDDGTTVASDEEVV